MKALTITGKKGQWEIKDPNNDEYPLVGPYDTKAEAEKIMRGLTRTYEQNPYLLENECQK